MGVGMGPPTLSLQEKSGDAQAQTTPPQQSSGWARKGSVVSCHPPGLEHRAPGLTCLCWQGRRAVSVH